MTTIDNATHRVALWFGVPTRWALVLPAGALAVYLLTGEAFWALSVLLATALVTAVARRLRRGQGRHAEWRGGMLGLALWLSATIVASAGHPDDATLFSATPLLFAAAGLAGELLFPATSRRDPSD